MQQFDIVIVGAGTAGLTAAIYALRAGKTVLVTEGESFGGQITSSPRVENYPGISQISGSEFADNLVSQAMELGADVELEKVIKIVDGKIKTVITESNSYQCKCVIIATGARHRPLGADGENDLAGRGVSYCAVCDGAFYKGKNVAVVGGFKDVVGLFRRNGFSGERRLLYLEACSLYYSSVCGDSVSGFENDDISGDKLLALNRHVFSVADDL